MKKFLTILVMLFLNGCVTEYYIPLSEDCMAKKIAEIKNTELYASKTKGYSSSLIYYEEQTENPENKEIEPYLRVYVVGNIKFDNKLKATFVPAEIAKDSINYAHSLKTIEKIKAIVDNINRDKYIEAIFMKQFDIQCYSGGGSVKIPYWLIEQEVRVKTELGNPLFLSALKHSLKNENIIFSKL